MASVYKQRHTHGPQLCQASRLFRREPEILGMWTPNTQNFISVESEAMICAVQGPAVLTAARVHPDH
jgi:hypothetical protein